MIIMFCFCLSKELTLKFCLNRNHVAVKIIKSFHSMIYLALILWYEMLHISSVENNEYPHNGICFSLPLRQKCVYFACLNHHDMSCGHSQYKIWTGKKNCHHFVRRLFRLGVWKCCLRAIHLSEFVSSCWKFYRKIRNRAGLLVAINNNMRLRMSKRTIIHFIAWRFSSSSSSLPM